NLRSAPPAVRRTDTPACAPWRCCQGVPMPPESTLTRAGRTWSLAAAAACLFPLLPQLPLALAIGIVCVGVVTSALSGRGRLPGWLRTALAVALIGAVLATYRF